MQTLEFMQDGKKKIVERKMDVSCHVCGAVLTCPDDQDFWVWSVSAPVVEFRADHLAHGNYRTVGAQIKTVERE